MSVTIREGKFLRIFLRNEDILVPENILAEGLEEQLKDKILDRLSRGDYLGGSLAERGYSRNKIKAHKLGWVNVEGSGQNKTMTIDGTRIDRRDWSWGTFNKPKKGHISHPEQSDFTKDGSPGDPPLPLFIPGYRVWRTKYQGKTSTVNLNMDGNLWDDLDVKLNRTRGSNQFGANFKIDVRVDGQSKDIANILDHYRNYMTVTREELKSAISESGLQPTVKV